MPRPTGVCVGSVVGVWSVCGSRWDSVCWRTISWLSGPPASEKPPMDKMERLARTQLKSGTISKAGGFSVRRHVPPSEVLQCLLERSLLRGGSRVPHGTCPHPGHLTTCQVVQVDRLVLATLGP